RDPRHDLRALRRRPGRALHAGDRRPGGAGHGRGRLRALPAAARLHAAHAARPLRHAARLPPPRPRAAGRGGCAVLRNLEWLRGVPGGAEWLDALPRLAAECAEEWGLKLGAPFAGSHVSLAVPAGDAVLKINFP